MKLILILSALVVGLSVINVHLIPHSHDDVGWLLTPEQYYDQQVQKIYDTLVPSLQKDSTRTFVIVEMYFFEKWWSAQNQSIKDTVKTFVQKEQIEFIGGGWSMEDEACASVHDMLNNMALGHQFLLNEFGIKPRIGWQIDPFGHSATQANIFSKMGFNGLFFGRYDHQEYDVRRVNKTLEMLWKPHKSRTGLYTQGFYDQNYCQRCFYFTVDQHGDWCNEYYNEMSEHYKTNHLLMPMGCDFEFQYAEDKFQMMDKMIEYYSSNPQLGINAFYSTPSKYLKSIYDAGIVLPVKRDEFFPYSNDNYSFWTGYFTSRPSQKLNVRKYSKLLHISQFLQVAQYDQDEMNNLNQLQRQMGINQHHDGITGTEKQAVADNYVKELVLAGENSTFKNIVGKLYNVETFQCPLLNQSMCNHSNNFIVYNPSFHSKVQTIRIPVQSTAYYVKIGDNLKEDHFKLKCTILANLFRPFGYHHGNHSHNWSNYENHNHSHTWKPYTLHLRVHLPQQSLLPIQLVECEEDECDCQYQRYEVYVPSEKFKIKQHHIEIKGEVGQFWEIKSEKKHKFHVGIGYYRSNPGDATSKQESGAYIFRPDDITHMHPLPFGHVNVAYVVNTHVVSEVVYEFIDEQFGLTSYLTARIDSSQNAVEIDNYLNSIYIDDNIGKEVILSVRSDIENKGVFYTDSNGQSWLRRQLNFSESYTPILSEPVAGNYYPLNGYISVSDENSQMTLLVDRCQGGSSLHEGQIEIMVNRRILVDDQRGVDEALNESEFGRGLKVRSNTWLHFGDKDEVKDFQKNSIEEEFQILFTNQHADKNLITLYPEEVDKFLKIYLRPISNNEFVIRLYNYHLNDQWVQFKIQDFVEKLLNKPALQVEELGLSENMSIEETKQRIQWLFEASEEDIYNNSKFLNKKVELDELVRIWPQGIKAFKVKL